MIKQNENLNAFVVINFEKQIENLSQEERQKVNWIILNGITTEELISVLKRTYEKSCKYYYWMCLASNKQCIYELVKLLEFMREYSFNYVLDQEVVQLYIDELNKASDETESWCEENG